MKENDFDLTSTDITKDTISFIRKTMYVSTFLYALFGILDYIQYPEYLSYFLAIRFLIVIPFCILLIIFSYSSLFVKYHQFFLYLIFVVAAVGIVFMIFKIEGINYYYSGLFLVFSIGFHILRLKWIYSLSAFFTVMSVFVVGGLYYDFITIEETFVYGFFYLSFAILGVFGGIFNDSFVSSQKYSELKSKEIQNRLQKEINENLNKINHSHEATIISIATLAESRDNLTGEHLNRVGLLAYSLSKRIPDRIFEQNDVIKDHFIKSIKLASVLHDIGKISVPDNILNKPGKLTKAEFEIIKTHTTVGADTLESIQAKNASNTLVSLGIEIAKYHHEKWDGSGYPEGLSGNSIPLSARIVAIIDVYDALISKRPYKEKFSKEKSLQILRDGSGKHFDPELVSLFIEIALETEKDSPLYQ